MAEALPLLGGIIPAAETYIENKFSVSHEETASTEQDDDISDFHRQVLSFIHPAGDTIAPKTEEVGEQPVQHNDEVAEYMPEVAHGKISSFNDPAEATVEHTAEAEHDEHSSYIHPAEETAEHTHEGISSFIQKAKENLEHKFDEVSPHAESHIHHLDQPSTHHLDQPHESAVYNHPEDNTAEPAAETPDVAENANHPEAVEHLAETNHGVVETIEDKVNEAKLSAAAYISSLLHHAPMAETHEQQAEPSFAESHDEKPVETAQQFHTPEPEHKQSDKPIEDEIFDEITGIEQIQTSQPAVEESEPIAYHQDTPEIPAPPAEPADSATAAVKAAEDKLIKGGMAVSDFFMFNRVKPVNNPAVPAETAPLVIPVAEPAKLPETPAVVPNDADNQDVSKYHDDKLPYSFLWWLDKTRKEHVGIFQPYIEDEKTPEITEPAGKTKSAEEALQQQYYENIFHITSVEELDKSTAISAPYNMPPTQLKKKEQVIMERFIKEEPQIRPQASDKLDNENKAKKSSEDRDELVTETLAAIYSDQMLYHKAIASYKKLILKFPEKSRYFADKIEALEKKTN